MTIRRAAVQDEEQLGGHAATASLTIVTAMLWGLAAAACSSPLDTPPVSISGIEIQPHPTNVLGAYVSFETDRLARPSVRFAVEGSDERFEVRGGAEGLQHRVFVYGLRAERRYRFWAVAASSSEVEVETEAGSFETQSLPPEVLRGEVSVLESDAVSPGWQLATTGYVSSLGRSTATVIYDLEGEPRWYYIHDEPGAFPFGDVHFLDDETLLIAVRRLSDDGAGEGVPAALIVDLEGRILWRGPDSPQQRQGSFHHQFERLEKGSFISLRYDIRERNIGDVLVELDERGHTIWQWNTFEHLEVPPPCSAEDLCDWTHGNWIVVDEPRQQVYYNARNTSTLYKIDKTSGSLLWRFGAGGDFSFSGVHAHPFFEQAHAPQLVAPGRLLIYDNGSKVRAFSRAVEYELDEAAMSARIVWEYPGVDVDDHWYTGSWGDADRMPNGNTVITAGTWTPGGRSRIFEVAADKRKVWEMLLPAAEREVLGAYNSKRIPELVRAVPLSSSPFL